MFKSNVSHPLIILWLLLSFAGVSQSLAQAPQQNQTLEDAATASRRALTLSADIEMTWRSGGVTKQTSGYIQLSKPNMARIVLKGDYPEVLLVSDGHTRFFAPNQSKFEKLVIDAKGLGIDSPWWGLPFRFFFSQSVNPFGADPDSSAKYSDFALATASQGIRLVEVRGSSPMGAYTETLRFNATGDLMESSVQFGEGSGAALFTAKLTNVRHIPIAAATFHFKPQAGQLSSSITDSMLALDSSAPSLRLPTPDGKTVTLAQQLRGRRAVLVNFWYYNCAPCRIEFPEFETLYQQFEGQGFTIVAVDKGDSPAVVSNYVKKTGLSFPVVLGGGPSKNSIFARYKVGDAFPGSYLLDANGKVVYRSAGEDLAGLKNALRQLGFQ